MIGPGPGRERPLRIGVIGSAEADEDAMAVARAVGCGLARAEAVLVCGGLGGVMAAAAEGAAAEGGTVVGLLPGDDARAAAPAVSIPLPTGLGEARNTLVVKASEAVIAVAGGWGTL
ncbi:MAG: TIGR00725 family protein, partial [Gemmatimonadota bacterium]